MKTEAPKEVDDDYAGEGVVFKHEYRHTYRMWIDEYIELIKRANIPVKDEFIQQRNPTELLRAINRHYDASVLNHLDPVWLKYFPELEYDCINLNSDKEGDLYCKFNIEQCPDCKDCEKFMGR